MGGGPSSTASTSGAGVAAAGAAASGGGAAGGGAGAGAEPGPKGRFLRVRLMDASFDLIASSESGDELSASRGWIARRTGATAARPAPVINEGQTLMSTSIAPNAIGQGKSSYQPETGANLTTETQPKLPVAKLAS